MSNDLKKYIKSHKSKVIQFLLWIALGIPIIVLAVLQLISVFNGGNGPGNDANVDIERDNGGTRTPQNTEHMDETIDSINQDINQ